MQTFWRVSEYISFRNGNYDLANYNQTFRRVWPNAREINVMRMASQTISAEIEPTDKLEWIMIMLRKFKMGSRVEERRGEEKESWDRERRHKGGGERRRGLVRADWHM